MLLLLNLLNLKGRQSYEGRRSSAISIKIFPTTGLFWNPLPAVRQTHGRVESETVALNLRQLLLIFSKITGKSSSVDDVGVEWMLVNDWLFIRAFLPFVYNVHRSMSQCELAIASSPYRP